MPTNCASGLSKPFRVKNTRVKLHQRLLSQHPAAAVSDGVFLIASREQDGVLQLPLQAEHHPGC